MAIRRAGFALERSAGSSEGGIAEQVHQHVADAILPAEEDGKDSDTAAFFLDLEPVVRRGV